MPLYEYVCRTCAVRFETMRKVSDRLNAPACPECGGAETSLAMSAPGMVGVAGPSVSDSGGGSCSTGGCCGGACGV